MGRYAILQYLRYNICDIYRNTYCSQISQLQYIAKKLQKYRKILQKHRKNITHCNIITNIAISHSNIVIVWYRTSYCRYRIVSQYQYRLTPNIYQTPPLHDCVVENHDILMSYSNSLLSFKCLKDNLIDNLFQLFYDHTEVIRKKLTALQKIYVDFTHFGTVKKNMSIMHLSNYSIVSYLTCWRDCGKSTTQKKVLV